MRLEMLTIPASVPRLPTLRLIPTYILLTLITGNTICESSWLDTQHKATGSTKKPILNVEVVDGATNQIERCRGHCRRNLPDSSLASSPGSSSKITTRGVRGPSTISPEQQILAELLFSDLVDVKQLMPPANSLNYNSLVFYALSKTTLFGSLGIFAKVAGTAPKKEN